MNRTQFSNHIQTAQDALDEERRRTAAEQQAFAQFYDHLTAIDPEQSRTTGGRGPSTTLRTLFGTGATNSAAAGEQIRTSYQKTVMAVPHYSDEYVESFATNMTAEFGRDLAVPIIENEPVAPQLRDGLLAASQQAHESRTQLIAAIDQEAASLSAAEETLTEIEDTLRELGQHNLTTESFDGLYERRRTLIECEERCETLTRERQRDVQERDLFAFRATEMVLQEFLYQSLPVTYPVLADVADRIERLRQFRQRVDRRLMVTP